MKATEPCDLYMAMACTRLLYDAPLSQEELENIIFAHIKEWSEEESEVNETDDVERRMREAIGLIYNTVSERINEYEKLKHEDTYI